MKKLFVSVLILSLVIACKKNPSKPVENVSDSIAQLTIAKIDSIQASSNKEEVLRSTNNEILQALKNKDYKKFTEFIHPKKGIRFSMYAFVNPDEDKHFSKVDFEKYVSTKTIFTWGAQDGSGDLYKETISNYLRTWVFSKDFTKSTYSLNTFQGKGNSLNNLKEIYPKHDFTENYIKGSDRYGEMDWKTLRFVFEEFNGKYYLIAVINDQWTI